MDNDLQEQLRGLLDACRDVLDRGTALLDAAGDAAPETRRRRRNRAAASRERPGRIKAASAWRLLGVSDRTFDRMVSSELFTMQKDGDGPGWHRYFFRDEIELYLQVNALKGPDAARIAVREHRIAAGRLKR